MGIAARPCIQLSMQLHKLVAENLMFSFSFQEMFIMYAHNQVNYDARSVLRWSQSRFKYRYQRLPIKHIKRITIKPFQASLRLSKVWDFEKYCPYRQSFIALSAISVRPNGDKLRSQLLVTDRAHAGHIAKKCSFTFSQTMPVD